MLEMGIKRAGDRIWERRRVTSYRGKPVGEGGKVAISYFYFENIVGMATINPDKKRTKALRGCMFRRVFYSFASHSP